MLRALVGVLTCLALLHSSIIPRAEAASTKSETPASDVFQAQYEVAEYMLKMFPEVDVNLFWAPCGSRNAYYYPEAKLVLLCTEMEGFPGTAVLFAAHEVAHAITHQTIDITDEGSADEVAAIMMVDSGRLRELLDAGLYFKRKSFLGHLTGDEHPSAGYRAWFFACMGSVDTNSLCMATYLVLKNKWQKRLVSYV